MKNYHKKKHAQNRHAKKHGPKSLFLGYGLSKKKKNKPHVKRLKFKK
tara:strand:+ start:90 stop:230 length:141 start_codon:yes stop_codon:yes gene_type:complete